MRISHGREQRYQGICAVRAADSSDAQLGMEQLTMVQEPRRDVQPNTFLMSLIVLYIEPVNRRSNELREGGAWLSPV